MKHQFNKGSADRFELLVKNDGVVATIATIATTSSQMEKMVSALQPWGCI